jgi:hypothetical protein
MKTNPYLQDKQVVGRLDWLRQNVLYILGGNFIWEVKTILSVHAEPVIWVNRDEQDNLLLNCRVEDAEGKVLLQMEDNDWTAYAPEDLDCPPGGQRIVIQGKDGVTRFTIDFSQVTAERFYEEWQPKLERGLKQIDEHIRQSYPVSFSLGSSSERAKQFLQEAISYMGSPSAFVMCTMNGHLRHRGRILSLSSTGITDERHNVLSYNFMGRGSTALAM